MPYGLFDYVPDNTIHTMGAAPYLPDYGRQQLTDLFYSKLGTRPTSYIPDTPQQVIGGPSSGSSSERIYTRAIPEGPTANLPVQNNQTDALVGSENPSASLPGTQVTTKMAYGEEGNPGNFQPPMTLAAICGEDPKFCRPVTMAIPEDPTQIIKPPTQQGQCPPGYGGPSPQPPRVAPIEEQIRMPHTSPITLTMGETTGFGLPAQGWGMSNTLPSR